MTRLVSVLLAMLAVAASFAARAEPDAQGCSDVFVTRLAGFYIRQCEIKEFDSYTFADGYPQQVRIEGRIVQNDYARPEGGPPFAPLQVRRNYEAALKQARWQVVVSDPDTLVEKQVKDGAERWMQLSSNGGDYYTLFLAQRGGMEQSVTSAADMHTALDKNGRVALSILFDTGKATIRRESQDLVAQIVALLKGAPALRLNVEGHTDNTGTASDNQALSEARARAVVAALVAKGIAAGRLRAVGYGQSKPVADNATDDGRAKNRRVELVKQ